jgi:uncharacterized integral membrane protein
MVNSPPSGQPWSPGTPDATPPAAARRNLRPSAKTILALVIAAAVIWFAFANTRQTQITFWLKTISAPMWIVLLGTFLAGLLTGWLVRRRRRP